MLQRSQVVLLVVILLLAGVESVTATTSLRPASSDTLRFARSRIVGENAAPTVQRLLRTDNTLGETDEERVISIKPIAALDKFKAGVEKITSAYKSKTTLGTLLRWAEKKKSPDTVFAKLKLDKATTLADNPNFMVWFAYARYVWADYAFLDRVIINYLTRKYGDVDLAKMIEAATQTKGTKAIATTLQNSQFNRWMVLEDDVWKKFDLGILTLFSREKDVSSTIWAKYVMHQAEVKKLQAAKP
ncbi:hypothetical protein PHYBOEH_012112 [Phytophthora boehmeriae]|uniref:RxLR effector protein n=1 Tax=Phytophthora boehmeriae TaxID=109152 RepID=A0A8T1VD41_9STRA|nr:hypothetical protein PHYBOEH_012112 [Phytophthora boehmeriae]